MDVLSGNRNGLGGRYFNFVAVAQGAGALVAARKIKTKRYENRQTDQLASQYPHKLTADEQNKMLQTLVNQQQKLIEKRDSAKGKQRAMVVGQLRAYDEYLNDVRTIRDELANQEKAALEQLQKQNEQMKQTSKVEEKVQSDVILGDVTKSPVENLAQNTMATKDNKMIYIGIGVIALVAIYFITRKK